MLAGERRKPPYETELVAPASGGTTDRGRGAGGQYPPRQRHSGGSLPHSLGGGRSDGRAVRSDGPAVGAVVLSGEPPQAEVLYGKALEFAGLTGTELAVDLYCGAGTITQVLARQARHVIGGEIVPEAIRDARASARRNGVENVEFLGGDAADVAAVGPAAAAGCHLRGPAPEGLAPEVIASIAAMAPPAGGVCLPATPARWAGM